MVLLWKHVLRDGHIPSLKNERVLIFILNFAFETFLNYTVKAARVEVLYFDKNMISFRTTDGPASVTSDQKVDWTKRL